MIEGDRETDDVAEPGEIVRSSIARETVRLLGRWRDEWQRWLMWWHSAKFSPDGKIFKILRLRRVSIATPRDRQMVDARGWSLVHFMCN